MDAVSDFAAAAKNKSRHYDRQSDLNTYFRKLKFWLKAGLMSAVLAPILLLSGYFHFQFNTTLKEIGKLHLSALAESQKNTVDLFLQERVVNVFSLFRSEHFSVNPSEQDMFRFQQNLQQMSDAFVDVGFFGEDGIQIAYGGPFPFLHGRDYSGEDWFSTLKQCKRNYHISDIYLGFRNKPHFTIAVKQYIGGKPYIMRATLDPDKFYIFLRTISQGKGVDSHLVNEHGSYQIVDPDLGVISKQTEYLPPPDSDHGVAEVRFKDGPALVAYARLTEVPWILKVRQPFSMAYARMYQARRIVIFSAAVLIAIVGSVIWITTDKLMNRAQQVAVSREELNIQLLHASKLASVGELAAGVAHEINNPLAIIGATSGVVRDMLDPRFNLEWKPEDIVSELDNLDAAIYRARGITSKLLNYARRNEPKLARININHLIDEVVGGIKEREFMVSNIRLVRDYDQSLPKTMTDPDQLSQVLLNIINNAGDAIEDGGVITLKTWRDHNNLNVAITDTGKGMTPEQMEKIFMPFYTTKQAGKGTGLGLSVSLSIVESMGGRIMVQSVPGGGSSFTVTLPIQLDGEVKNGAK